LTQSTVTSTQILATEAGRLTWYVALPLKGTGFGLNTGFGRFTGFVHGLLPFASVSASVPSMSITLPDSLFVAVMVVLHEPSAFVQGVLAVSVT
jgi:hypothetical protein